MTTHRVTRRKAKDRSGVKLLVLKDGRNVARWRDPLDGSQQQQSLDKLKLTTAKAREDWAAAKSTEIAKMRAGIAAGVVEAERVGLAGAIDRYLQRFGHAPTAKTKRHVLDAMATWLRDKAGLKDAADIKPLLLVQWRDHVLAPGEDGNETSTRNRWLSCCGSFLRWAAEQGLCPLLSGDAIRAGTKRAKQPVHEIDFLRPEQCKQLLVAAMAHDQANAPVAPFVLAMLTTGARFEELRGLAWADVDLRAGEIRLRAENVKTRRGRTVTLQETPKMLAMLNALAANRGRREHVFDLRDHATWDRARRRLIETYKAPEHTAHTLRRTCGTALTCAPSIYGAASAFLSARRLGHSVVMSERLYAGRLSGLPALPTLEGVLGIEAECDAIVARVSGGVAAVAQ